ncbi:tRNA (guanosine(46)-N7)-methyltransferase TrmB [Bacteroidota bacterium]
MARTKSKKLAKVGLFPNVFQFTGDSVEGKLKEYFGNDKNISLEIGCGHGDFSINLAQVFSNRNFLGVDTKGARVWMGAKEALDLKLKNVAFLITRAENLAKIFTSLRIEEIYLPFPDPHLRRRSAKNRLVSALFLDIYKTILVKGGKIHLKTDNEALYKYAISNIEKKGMTVYYITDNLYSSEGMEAIKSIRTSYEEHYLSEGRVIKYLCFGS